MISIDDKTTIINFMKSAEEVDLPTTTEEKRKKLKKSFTGRIIVVKDTLNDLEIGRMRPNGDYIYILERNGEEKKLHYSNLEHLYAIPKRT